MGNANDRAPPLDIRAEAPGDREAVRSILTLAFGRTSEADLVDALRENAQPKVSLVADKRSQAIGCVFFSTVTVGTPNGDFSAWGLGPMAVLPEYQRQGVGSILVRHGLAQCQRLGPDVVVVLGHPSFYPRFGFVPARTKGLTCEYPVPDEVFMVAELTAGALAGRSGLVKYGPEFGTTT